MYPGTIPYLLREVGRELDDRDDNRVLLLYEGSTNSNIHPRRAVDALDDAQFEVFHTLLDDNANKGLLAREVALTAVSGDSTSWSIPIRTIEILRVRDSEMDTDDEGYPPIHSALDWSSPGYRIGPRGEVIQFPSFPPDSSLTLYATVIEEPCHLSYGTIGQAATSSTNFVFAATPDYGQTILEDDYYNYADAVICSATTGGGLERPILDYTGSSRTAAVASWTVTADAKYSIKLSLPRPVWRLVVLKSCVEIARWYKPESIEYLQQKYEAELSRLTGSLRKPFAASYPQPRVVTRYRD